VPENDRIYSDCPHVTAIIASYVDDNLAFTNCTALAAEFEVHCNVEFLVNAEGPVNWYLSIKYDCDPTTGAVSAHKDLYIDKLLEKWGMEQCNPLHTLFSQKADDRQRTCRTGSNSRRETRQRIPNSGRQFPLYASTHFSRKFLASLSTKHIHDSTRSYSSGDSQETGDSRMGSQSMRLCRSYIC